MSLAGSVRSPRNVAERARLDAMRKLPKVSDSYALLGDQDDGLPQSPMDDSTYGLFNASLEVDSEISSLTSNSGSSVGKEPGEAERSQEKPDSGAAKYQPLSKMSTDLPTPQRSTPIATPSTIASASVSDANLNLTDKSLTPTVKTPDAHSLNKPMATESIPEVGRTTSVASIVPYIGLSLDRTPIEIDSEPAPTSWVISETPGDSVPETNPDIPDDKETPEKVGAVAREPVTRSTVTPVAGQILPLEIIVEPKAGAKPPASPEPEDTGSQQGPSSPIVSETPHVVTIPVTTPDENPVKKSKPEPVKIDKSMRSVRFAEDPVIEKQGPAVRFPKRRPTRFERGNTEENESDDPDPEQTIPKRRATGYIRPTPDVSASDDSVSAGSRDTLQDTFMQDSFDGDNEPLIPDNVDETPKHKKQPGSTKPQNV